jgi:hypothetical protein
MQLHLQSKEVMIKPPKITRPVTIRKSSVPIPVFLVRLAISRRKTASIAAIRKIIAKGRINRQTCDGPSYKGSIG